MHVIVLLQSGLNKIETVTKEKGNHKDSTSAYFFPFIDVSYILF